MKYRLEKDSLGEMKVPQNAYYGAQTQRAVENFQISNLRFSNQFIQSLALIKKSSAKVNTELGLLDKDIAEVIISVAEEIINGKVKMEESVLKNAPHTMELAVNDEWNFTYSREKAVYPLKWIKDNKFWPSIRRINDAYGDRNLVCTFWFIIWTFFCYIYIVHMAFSSTLS